MRPSLLPIFAILTFLAVVDGKAQQWPDPYTTPNTLGKVLEDGFTEALRGCGLNGIIHERVALPDVRKSSIPTQVRNDLRQRLREPVQIQTTGNAARLLGYIFPNEASALSLQTPDASRLVAVDVSQDPISMLEPGTSSLAHAHSCRSIVAAALSANAGVSVPAAHVKAALESEFNRQTTTTMVLTEGKFLSPLAYGLTNSNATPAERLAARLLVWDWYGNHTGLISAPNWYITGFEGGTIYRTLEDNETRTGKIDVSAGANVPGIASVEAALRAALNLSSKTQISRFITFHYRDPANGNRPSLQLATLPSPSTLMASVHNLVRPQFQNGVNVPLTDLQPHFHTVELTGVPNKLCNNTFWDVALVDGTPGRIRLEKVDSLRGTPLACRFTVSYSLSPLPTSGETTLRYNLVTSQTLGADQIRFPVELPLNTEFGPVVQSRVINPDWEVAGAGALLRWKLEYQVYDRNNTIDFTKPVTLDPSNVLTCASVPVQINVSQPTVGADRTVTIMLERPLAGTNFELQAPPVECTYTGTLAFAAPGVAGGTLRRPIPPTRIRYPASKP